MIPITCGIFLLTRDSRELLISHPTNSPITKWSIPKGLKHENESDLTCAYREFEEETSISKEVIENHMIEILCLGIITYKSNKKRLTGFLIVVDDKIKEHALVCNSLIDNSNQPENDITKWEQLKTAKPKLHEAQIRLLNKI